MDTEIYLYNQNHDWTQKAYKLIHNDVRQLKERIKRVFLLDLFNLYSEMCLRLIGIMRRFINSRYNLNNIL